jgi:hypothetical protein
MYFRTHTFWTSAADQVQPPLFSSLQDLQRSAFWNNLARALEVNPKPSVNWQDHSVKWEGEVPAIRDFGNFAF